MTLPSWHVEIVELHAFVQGWLDGTLPATDEAYARLTDTQAPELVIVTPGGSRTPSYGAPARWVRPPSPWAAFPTGRPHPGLAVQLHHLALALPPEAFDAQHAAEQACS